MGIDFPDEWNGLSISDAWTKENSGGLPTSEAGRKSWAKNPQFKLTLDVAANVFLVLYQKDGRVIKEAKHPFKDQIHPVNLAILRQNPQDKQPRLTEYIYIYIYCIDLRRKM